MTLRLVALVGALPPGALGNFLSWSLRSVLIGIS
jgi:hypothetical protein